MGWEEESPISKTCLEADEAGFLSWAIPLVFKRLKKKRLVVLPECIFVQCVHNWCPWRSEKDMGSPGNGVIAAYERLEPNLSPLSHASSLNSCSAELRVSLLLFCFVMVHATDNHGG